MQPPRPAYSSPFTGGATSKLVKQQWPILPSVRTAPHITGKTLASTSSAGAWQAALIAALLLPANGIPGGYFRSAFALAVCEFVPCFDSMLTLQRVDCLSSSSTLQALRRHVLVQSTIALCTEASQSQKHYADLPAQCPQRTTHPCHSAKPAASRSPPYFPRRPFPPLTSAPAADPPTSSP